MAAGTVDASAEGSLGHHACDPTIAGPRDIPQRNLHNLVRAPSEPLLLRSEPLLGCLADQDPPPARRPLRTARSAPHLSRSEQIGSTTLESRPLSGHL